MADAWDAASAEWEAQCAAIDASSGAASAAQPSEGVQIDTSDVLRGDLAAPGGMGLSENTAGTLAKLGVVGASADALQDSIMGQVNRAAQAQQDVAQKKREAREAAARAAARKRGQKTADAVQAKAHRQKQKTRQQKLGAEVAGLRQQIDKVQSAMSQLDGSRDAADKQRRVLAAKKSKLKNLEGEMKVLELLGQKAPARGSGGAAAEETERERLIRTGKITPFQKVRSIPYQGAAGSRFMGARQSGRDENDSSSVMKAVDPKVLERSLRSTAMSRVRAARRYGHADTAAARKDPHSIGGREAGFQKQLAEKRQRVAELAATEGGGAKPAGTKNPKKQKKLAAPARQPGTADARVAAEKKAAKAKMARGPSQRSEGTAAAAAGSEPGGAGAFLHAQQEAGNMTSQQDEELAKQLQAELNAGLRPRRPRREKKRPVAADGEEPETAGAWAANISDDDSSDEECRDRVERTRGEQSDDDDDLFTDDDESSGEHEEEDDEEDGEEENLDVLEGTTQQSIAAAARGRRHRSSDTGGGVRAGAASTRRRRSDGTSTHAASDGDDILDEEDTWTSLTSKQQHALQTNSTPDVVLDGGLRVPGSIHANLLDYQKTGLTWMWELHSQRVGGIIGDEMGLGKTIQVIALLGALSHSDMLRAPSLVVAPATLLQQWARELATWAPFLPTVVFHDSAGTGHSSVSHLDILVDAVSAQSADGGARLKFGVVITTYEQIRSKLEALLAYDWHYLILDEGHKIRNPDSGITLAVKQFDTAHRLIMSGSPIQNSLTELWSLFDFVLPGKLGTLPVFKEQFELPITIGGYSNASSVQVETAYRCSVVLRDLIGPYLLRRLKKDVGTSLPAKTEQVLFCSLTEKQRNAYLDFLDTEEMRSTLAGKRKPFAAITELRKICNHPDLCSRLAVERPDDYGVVDRSGKLLVAEQILGMWHLQQHRVLVFSQTKQMLDIIENSVQDKGWTYRRMDGSLAIKQRLALIDEYNSDTNIYAFLLTTKVGGLGINLTGADRVLLFDPDWNPSTDMQARERSWRLGQKKPVTVYRLLTAGTIEEKMYHRQVFKMMLTNKVLEDPMQRRFFKSQWLQDLFTLDDRAAGQGGGGAQQGNGARPHRRRTRRGLGSRGREQSSTETQALFADASITIEDADAGGDMGVSGGVGAAGAGDGGARGGAATSAAVNSTGADCDTAAAAASGPAASVPKDVSEVQGIRAGGIEDEVAPDSDDDTMLNGDAGKGHKADNAKVLRSLFDGDGGGVTGAISHDKIMGEKAVDTVVVRQRAERIAQHAAEELARSRGSHHRSSLTTPTWTGRSGEGGMMRSAQSQRQRQGLASREEQANFQTGGKMAAEIISLLTSCGGRASTADIIAHFQNSSRAHRVRVTTAREMELFRQLLKQLAKLDKKSRLWTLKESDEGDGM